MESNGVGKMDEREFNVEIEVTQLPCIVCVIEVYVCKKVKCTFPCYGVNTAAKHLNKYLYAGMLSHATSCLNFEKLGHHTFF